MRADSRQTRQPHRGRVAHIRYIFDQVFGMNATQEEVFEHTVKPLLPGVLDGLNATAFAYGVSPLDTLTNQVSRIWC